MLADRFERLSKPTKLVIAGLFAAFTAWTVWSSLDFATM